MEPHPRADRKLAQPFTAPAEIPRTKSRIVNKKISTSGNEAIEYPAIISPHCFTYSPSSLIKPAAKVKSESSRIIIKGSRKSFQTLINCKIASVEITEPDIGKTI